MGVVSLLQRARGAGVAVDLGTVNTLVYSAGREILDEPSALAVNPTKGTVVAVGRPAAVLCGRSPEDVEVIKPLRDGVISDAEACSRMLDGFLRQVWRHPRFGRHAAFVCVPGCATEVERRALLRAVEGAIPHFQITLVEEAVAAALGCGADLGDGGAVLVVDIGGGTTELGVVVAGGLVRSRSIRVGGNEMDAAVVHAVREQLGLTIGERTAERLKITFGLSGEHLELVPVTGVAPGAPGHLREVEVPAALVEAALARPVASIIDALDDLLAVVPPDLAQEVLDRGVYLAGGGALLHGLAARLADATGCAAKVADDPLRCVLRGLVRLVERGAERTRAA